MSPLTATPSRPATVGPLSVIDVAVLQLAAAGLPRTAAVVARRQLAAVDLDGAVAVVVTASGEVAVCRDAAQLWAAMRTRPAVWAVSLPSC